MLQKYVETLLCKITAREALHSLLLDKRSLIRVSECTSSIRSISFPSKKYRISSPSFLCTSEISHFTDQLYTLLPKNQVNSGLDCKNLTHGDVSAKSGTWQLVLSTFLLYKERESHCSFEPPGRQPECME